MRSSILTALLVIAVACTCSSTATANDSVEGLKKTFEGKILCIRNSYAGKELRYDSNGKLSSAASKGTWLADTAVKLSKVSVSGHTLELSGERLFQVYDPKGVLVARPTKRTLQIWVELPATVDAASLDRILHNIFYSSEEVRSADAPAHQHQASDGIEPPIQVATLLDGEKVYLPMPPLKPPKIVKAADPEYTDSARKDQIQGTCVFAVVIDGKGRVNSLQLVKPLGSGLDESAAEALSKWQYEPALLNGVPVAVRIGITVNFQM